LSPLSLLAAAAGGGGGGGLLAKFSATAGLIGLGIIPGIFITAAD
jgi:hypothetical protein